ncbi:hypothetical protein [Serratia sp. M24T3]|uniref:hypothetical protein n=1 Tax=Serratia sp. M24T3 TaxID=932213 RepID=UPI00025B9EE7|nr:hypothetical protein [Serratia sp. M24T3]EIC86083.1 hypothetical protein SPM24T3_01758 [Serratia sp. M24T3]
MTRKFAEKNHQPEIYHSKREKDSALYTGMTPEMEFRLINPLHSLLFALALNAAMSGTAEKSRVENSGRGKYATKHQSDDLRQQQSPSAALSLAQPTAANDGGTDIAESLLDMGNTFDRLLSKTLNYPFQAILPGVGAQDTTQPAILQPSEIVSMDGHRLAHWNTISSKWSFIDERYQLKTNPSESDWAVSTEQNGKQTLINGIECITIQVNQTHITVPVSPIFRAKH